MSNSKFSGQGTQNNKPENKNPPAPKPVGKSPENQEKIVSASAAHCSAAVDVPLIRPPNPNCQPTFSQISRKSTQTTRIPKVAAHRKIMVRCGRGLPDHASSLHQGCVRRCFARWRRNRAIFGSPAVVRIWDGLVPGFDLPIARGRVLLAAGCGTLIRRVWALPWRCAKPDRAARNVWKKLLFRPACGKT